MKDTKKSFLSKASIIIFSIVGALMLFFLVYLCVSNNISVEEPRASDSFNRIEDCSWEEIEDANAPIGVITKYHFTISDTLSHDTCLAFYLVHQYAQVYLDGELVYRLEPVKDDFLIKTPGSNWAMIPIYHEDAGKEVIVIVTPVYENFRDREVEFLIGSQLAIYIDRLTHDLPSLIISGLICFIGLVFLCTEVHNQFVNERGWNLFLLGVFAVFLGIWRFTDTRFSPYLVPDNTVFLYYLSCMALMVGIIPWMKSQKGRISAPTVDIYCIAVALLCIIQTLLQLFGIIDLREALTFTHVMLIVGVLIMVYTLIFQRIKHPRKDETYSPKIMLWIITVGMSMDGFIYFTKGDTSNLLFTQIAFLFYVIFIGVMNIKRFIRQEQKLVEKEQQVILSRITAMTSQIRSHFVFNILNAISGMCKYDPEMADRTVVCFARYLRANIDIMQDDQMVPFHMALQHMEDYIALEKIRFGDKIQFVKEIETEEFMMPSLILQPIVENAIKHGLMPKPSGGTITLRIRKGSDEIYISIHDDGVGFDVNDVDNCKSVGLKNVRFRLQYIMNGRLDIKSVPGLGTTVIISVPSSHISRT